MQKRQYQPRLENLDQGLAQQVLATLFQIREDDMREERSGPLKRPQTHYSCASRNSQDIGHFLYALGHPLHDVHRYLVEAVHYLYKVFELHGTQSSFPVTVITTDVTERVIRHEPLHPLDYVDHSLTNSARGLKGIYLALITGKIELALSIAEMIGDPPDADYIHPKSEVCTIDQQHLAYAVKYLLFGNTSSCLEELAQIGTDEAASDVRHQADMVQAIALGQPDVFLRNLETLLDWHEKTDPRVTRRTHPDYPKWFLSIPGLGLVALAQVRGIVDRVNLSSVYLPVDLLASN